MYRWCVIVYMCSVGGLRRVGTSDQSTVAAHPAAQLLLHSYPQLQLVLVETTLEHSVSYTTMIERVLLLLCTHYSCK